MAMATSRIRIGTTVTPLPRRRPWKVAAEAVALDYLSDGRFVLGVGIGDRGDPFMGSADPKELAEMLDEGLKVIDRLWTGEPLSFNGTHYQLDNVQLTARPVQRPRIPIWVGGNMLVPAVRRRVLRWDGSCAYKRSTDGPQQVTPDDVRALLAERGDPFDVKVSGGDLAEFAAAGATWWGRWIACRTGAHLVDHPAGTAEALTRPVSRGRLRMFLTFKTLFVGGRGGYVEAGRRSRRGVGADGVERVERTTSPPAGHARAGEPVDRATQLPAQS
jgi:hypothetical protein